MIKKQRFFKNIKGVLLVVCFVGIMSNCLAIEKEKDNPRIKTIVYQNNQVIELRGTHFVSTGIQFDKHEKILGVYIGDQVAWTYAIHPEIPSILFIKPTLDSSNTNMTVMTRQHLYHFHLIANRSTEDPNDAVYHLQMRLSNTNNTNQVLKSAHIKKPKSDLQNESINTNYKISGSFSIVPTSVWDDGQFTYFKFSKHKLFPAIFRVDHNQKKLINVQIQDNLLIAKCIAKHFLLVSNDDKVWVENKNNDDNDQ